MATAHTLFRASKVRVLPLFVVLAAVGIGVAAGALWVLYRSELDRERAWLAEVAETESRFIEAVAAFDAEYSREDNPEGWFGATLDQIRAATSRGRGWGETGHRHLTELRADSLVWLLHEEGGQRADDHRSALDGFVREALSGRSGLTTARVGPRRLLVAYRPVRIPGRVLALTATRDLSEVNRPYRSAAVVILGLVVLFVGVGGVLLWRAFRPTLVAAEEGERRHRQLLLEAPVPIVITAMDGTFVEANERAAAFFGEDRESLIGRNARDYYADPSDRPSLLEAVQAKGSVTAWELQLRQPDGQAVHVLASVRLRRTPGDRPDEMETFLTEVTELKASEARYFALFEHAPDMLVSVYIEDLRIRECNSAFVRATGRDREELIGASFLDLVQSPDRAAAAELRRRVVDIGAAEGAELTLNRKDGRALPVSVNASAIRNAEDRVVAARLSLRDLTERKKIAARLERVLEGSQDGYWEWLDVEQDEFWWSDRFYRLLGYEPGELETNLATFQDLIHPADAAQVEMTLTRLRETAGAFDTVYRIRRKDGSYIWCQFRGRVYPDADGKPTSMAGTVRDITAAREIEEALQRTAWHLAQAQEIASVGSWDWNPSTGEVTWSDEMFRLYGRDPDQGVLDIKHALDPVHPDDRELLAAAIAESLETGSYEVEYRLHRENDGTARVLHAMAEVEFDANGEAVRHVGVAVDVTAEVEARSQLEAERQRAQRYLDVAEVMLVAVDADGRIEMINRKGCAILEAEESELLGRDWFETALPPQAVPEVREVFRQLLRGEVAPVEYHENVIVTASGRERIMAWHNSTLTDADGAIRGIFSSGEDITERTRMERALIESEHRYRLLFNSMQEGFALHEIIWDDDGQPADYRFLQINPAFCRLTGLDADQLVGRTILEVLPGTDEDLIKRYGEVARTGNPTELDYGSQELGGHYRISAFRPQPGQFAVTLTDITEQTVAVQALQASEQRLRSLYARLNRIREEERSEVARDLHDQLGQALTGLRMDLAADRLELTADQSDLRERLDRLIATTDSTIDLVRSLSSRLRPPILDVMGLGPAIEWLVEDQMDRAQCHFHLDVPETKLGLSGGQGISLFRIAQEALTNILRHARADHVWITLRTDAERVLLSVSDDGVGVPSDGIESSVGLVGMRERARGLGGELTIAARDGGGTEVRVEVPLSPVPGAESA